MSKLPYILNVKTATLPELIAWVKTTTGRTRKFKTHADAVEFVTASQEATLEMEAGNRRTKGEDRKEATKLVKAIVSRDPKADKKALAVMDVPTLKGKLARFTYLEPEDAPAIVATPKAPKVKKENKPAAVALAKKDDGKGYTDGVKDWTLRERSEVKKPCDVARCIFADPDNKGKERKVLIDLCVKDGVNISTAKTQYSWYQRKLAADAAKAAGQEVDDESGEE